MKTKNLLILIAIVILKINFTFAQTQTIKGKITDSESLIELPTASVIVLNSNPIIGTSTDLNGNFVLKNVPVGRV
jgi:hypothetical protein